MKRFTLPLFPNSQLRIVVRIFSNNEKLNLRAKKKLAAKNKISALCHQINLRGEVLAELWFSKDEVSPLQIMHECEHCVWMYWRYLISKNEISAENIVNCWGGDWEEQSIAVKEYLFCKIAAKLYGKNSNATEIWLAKKGYYQW